MDKTTRVKARITSKCQIPKEVREEPVLKPGDDVEFVRENGHFFVRRPYDPSGLMKYKGFLKHLAGQDVDELIEDMRAVDHDCRDEYALEATDRCARAPSARMRLDRGFYGSYFPELRLA
ncbi:MAG TPA: hypothetical protein VFY10_06900 [Dehalococcoidia bacterium]|nr:hypothetical protein [Dehalococcoidia bacterium]